MPAAKREEEEGFEKYEVVCMGKVQVVGDKLGVKFAVLEEGGRLGREAIFAGKNLSRCVPGGVYEVLMNDAQAKGGFKWLRTYPDRGAVAGWQAQSEAAEVAHRALKLEKEEGKRNEMLKALNPVRVAYRRTDRIGRLALEVVLLDLLRRGE